MTVGTLRHFWISGGVNNRSNLHNHHHRHTGLALVMVVTITMLTAYRNGRLTQPWSGDSPDGRKAR
ncbi:hypothetical protein, partial [Ectothiorhodospira variabilis]|uniref:hypothetical protein n=1 Tax=Ectothiorhodospira variabilis TaxID=505694 RepID=UPI001EFBEF24